MIVFVFVRVLVCVFLGFLCVDFWEESLPCHVGGYSSFLVYLCELVFVFVYVLVFVFVCVLECICGFSGVWIFGERACHVGSRFLASSLGTFPVRYTKALALQTQPAFVWNHNSLVVLHSV